MTENAVINKNADRIRTMSDEKLAEFMESLAFEKAKPWDKPFLLTFCNECPASPYVISGSKNPIPLRKCELDGEECPHGSKVLWWLRQSAEDNAYE